MITGIGGGAGKGVTYTDELREVMLNGGGASPKPISFSIAKPSFSRAEIVK